MDIRIGHQYVNKTWRFLVPTLRGHGDEFVNRFNPLFKLACGVHDDLISGAEMANGRNIYVMFDTKYQPKEFSKFMDFLQYKDYYKADYCPDSEISSRKRIVILEVPKIFHNAYDMFLQGRYSEMYTQEHLDMLFNNENKKREHEILNKHPRALSKFVKDVNEQFKTQTKEDDFLESEYETPLKKIEEIFNYRGESVFFNEKIDKVWQ